MPLLFRRARPEDSASAIPLIYSSGPQAFDYSFNHGGKTALAFLRFSFSKGHGQFGCHNHWVAEQDGRVVATGTTYSGRQTIAYMLRSLQQILAFYGAPAAFTVLRRGLSVEALIKPPARNTLYLAHLGVQPGLTGKGIGQQLIDHLIKQARPEPYSEIALDVAVSNPRAQHLYERLGFKVVLERHSKIPPVVNHRYMSKPYPTA